MKKPEARIELMCLKCKRKWFNVSPGFIEQHIDDCKGRKVHVA